MNEWAFRMRRCICARERSVRTVTPAVVLLALAMSACREGVTPFTPPVRDYGGPIYALTFGAGQDSDPGWAPSGDHILYHTTQFMTVPGVSGVVLLIPADGGTAEPVFGDLQRPGARAFATPAISPDGERVAYMDMMSVDAPRMCRVAGFPPDEAPECAPQPLLDSAVLRVRRIGEQRNFRDDPALPVRFSGTDPGSRMLTDGPWYEQLFPFQAQHRQELAMLFRPSWAPDGENIAFSDGLAIHVWNVGAAASTVVPGTEDGVSAAWSPDGQWIAYAEIARTDSAVQHCACAAGLVSFATFRTVYDMETATIVVMRPDGSERLDLGEGADPAWSPDGSFIYARRADGIYRIARSDGSAALVANTDRGRAPAVSPDGGRLAFSRSKPAQLTLDYDIWIVSLDQ